MAHINLLPWREENRQVRQRNFFGSITLGLIIAGAIFLGANIFMNQLIAEQEGRNTFLQTEITRLDKKLAEIKALDEEKAKLLARMQVIQQLQLSRAKIVKVFDALPRCIPEGLYLEKVALKEDILTLNGVAESNARVSVLMRELEGNGEFTQPKLDVIQRTSTAENALRKFTLRVTETKAKADVDGGNDESIVIE